MARAKRGFPIPFEAGIPKIFSHLDLIADDNRLTNAALLLFAKKPQSFFITSEVKCAQFYGNEIAKPIPSYQVYRGNVFQLIDQAVDFVMSRIDARVGTREKKTDVDIDYELPLDAVREAIVNAVTHRDYTSNASVQVMLFRNRLEVWNPGSLPYGLTTAKLLEPHPSVPTNPILANPIYLAGYIERMGTGTGDIVDKCVTLGLKTPEFIQEEDFKVILWRKDEGVNDGVNLSQTIENKVSKIYTLIGEGVNDGVNEGVTEVLEVILDTSGLNAIEISNKIDRSLATIERYLRLLREQGIIEFKGAPKTGGYYFTDKVNRLLSE